MTCPFCSRLPCSRPPTLFCSLRCLEQLQSSRNILRATYPKTDPWRAREHMVPKGSSRTHPSVPIGRSQADIEESISMKVGNLVVLSHEPYAAETVGTEPDAGHGPPMDLDLFHGRKTFRMDDCSSQKQENIKHLRYSWNTLQEAELLDGEAEHGFRIPRVAGHDASPGDAPAGSCRGSRGRSTRADARGACTNSCR